MVASINGTICARLDAFVEIHEPLTELGVLRVVLINGDERGLQILKLIALATQVLQKRPQASGVADREARHSIVAALG